MSSIHRVPLLFLFLTLALLLPFSIRVTLAAEFFPADRIQYRPVTDQLAASSSRRMLAPFQLCLDCRCCSATNPTSCSSMPCCFGIDCNLPDKPYGVCAFVPKTCHCTSCA